MPVAGILITAVLLTGCGGSGTGGRQHRDAVHDSTVAVAGNDRWRANPETFEGIRGMQALADGFPANGLSGPQLRDSLDARMAMIFERCTMDGEAHEALHRYLLPMLGMIKRLPDAPSDAHVDSLRQHLRHFDEVFQ